MAGPNGSGKSTPIRHGALDAWTGGVRALSPDDVVLELRAKGGLETELELLRAAQAQSDGQVDAAISAGQTVMVETVLSSTKFELRVRNAAAAGFGFGFVYVTVSSPELNAARVLNRVARGGHDVPDALIRSRRERSHAAMTWFAEQADIGLVFDNSGTVPVLLAEKRFGGWGWIAHDVERLATLRLALPA